MLAEFVEKILSQRPTRVIEVNGVSYSTDKIYAVEPPPPPAPGTVVIDTLTGIVDYIGNAIDDDFSPISEKRIWLHVASPTDVILYSHVDMDTLFRVAILKAKFPGNQYPFDRYMDQDKFVINLMTMFEPTEALGRLMQVAGNIANSTVSTSTDDGVTQTVNVKSGIAKTVQVEFQNPVPLKPFRTFGEVSQPESPFVFRVQKQNDAIAMALHEAGGNRWRMEAMMSTKTWLMEQMPDIPVIA